MVHGIKHRASSLNTDRVDHLYQDPHIENRNFVLHYGDLTDSLNITRIIQQVQPDEIYNLGAQSHVQVSFETPEYTANVDALGTLRILEAVRLLGLTEKTKIYQASTSELYGGQGKEQELLSETTPFKPRSPYACAKLYAFAIVKNYREAYGMFACNGILFNHESPLRGETFVTRKITRAGAKIALGGQECLYLGNLSAKRDWSHAKDMCRGMYLLLQQNKPDDYVLATGVTTTMRDFVRLAFGYIGVTIQFSGTGVAEQGVIEQINETLFVEKVGVACPLQIGHAVWIEKNCVVLTDGVECGNCARHCPTGAITMIESKSEKFNQKKIPVVNVERCIGCGACENLCPSRPFSAMYVEGHEMHRKI